MARIANPIYDAAFKYLMDSPRVAQVLIAAILEIPKSNILEVIPDRNDIITGKRDGINVCRLDYCVKIRTKENIKTVYIELQKAVGKGEIARFRKYLAAQYNRKSNVDKDKNPLPIIPVYILGDKIKELTESVSYIKRSYFKQKNIPYKEDVSNDFTECLSHDMIVIQIPRLNPRPDSTLDNILTIFDQNNKDKKKKQVVYYDIDDYDIPKGELREDMRYMVRRLEEASVSDDVLMEMDLEDKAEELINERKKAFDLLNESQKELQESKKELQEKDNQLQESKKELQESKKELQKKDNQLATVLSASINILLKQGIAEEEIAKNLNITVEEVKKYM